MSTSYSFSSLNDALAGGRRVQIKLGDKDNRKPA